MRSREQMFYTNTCSLVKEALLWRERRAKRVYVRDRHTDERELAAIGGQRESPCLAEDHALAGKVEAVLHSGVHHLPGREVDVHRGRPLRDEGVPGAEERVRQRAVDRLPHRVALAVE